MRRVRTGAQAGKSCNTSVTLRSFRCSGDVGGHGITWQMHVGNWIEIPACWNLVCVSFVQACCCTLRLSEIQLRIAPHLFQVPTDVLAEAERLAKAAQEDDMDD
jgi:hypothetical protein